MSDTNIDQVLLKGVENATIRDIPNVTCKEGLMKSAIEVTKMITDESDRKNDETNRVIGRCVPARETDEGEQIGNG